MWKFCFNQFKFRSINSKLVQIRKKILKNVIHPNILNTASNMTHSKEQRSLVNLVPNPILALESGESVLWPPDSAVGCSYNTNAPCWYMLTQLQSCTKAFSSPPLYASEDCGTWNPCWISQSWSPFPILIPYPGIVLIRHIFARFPSDCENPSTTSYHCLRRKPETPIICVLIDCLYCKSSTQVT